METQDPRVLWTMTMLPKRSCSTETPQSKVLANHWCNSYSTANSVIPFLYKPHSKWVAAAQCWEEILFHHNAKIVERYNKYTHNLPLLQADDTVAIQSPLDHRWNMTGKIISALPDHQYRIRVNGSGRITLRNNCFLRKCKFKPTPTPIPSATPGPINPTSNAPLTSSSNGTCTAMEPPTKQATHTSPCLQLSRIPQVLSRLLPHNRSGLKEGYSPHTTRPTHDGWKGEM